LPGNRRGELATLESEGLQDREISPPPPHRRQQHVHKRREGGAIKRA